MTETIIDDPVLIKKAYEMQQSGMFASDISKQLSEETGKRITQMALWRAFKELESKTELAESRDDIKNKKRRQGQGGAKPKEICPKCGKYLQSCYMRGSIEEKRNMKKIGLCCPSPSCDYLIKDFVEIEHEVE